MPPPTQVGPPLPWRILLPFLILVSLLVGSHLVAVRSSPSYAETARDRYEDMRSRLGLGSDGMPVGWDAQRKQEEGVLAKEWGSSESWSATGGAAHRNSSSDPNGPVRAAFVSLTRNQEVWEIVSAMQSLLDRCESCRKYEWVFLNDQEFSDEFKRATSTVAPAACHYGLVPRSEWEEPGWIDETKAAEERKKMEDNKVIYGGSKTYRRMCRYQSGYFFRHKLLAGYDYYWRLEPSVKFCPSPLLFNLSYCNIPYDPFVLMRDKDLKYGFTVSLYEYESTIPTLWKSTKDFIAAHPEHLAKPNAMDWLSNDGGETYNRCHFWIGSLSFLRSKAYLDYFDHLDRAGGFSYERWGDAPVHSIAAALFLKPSEIHYFQDIGCSSRFLLPPFPLSLLTPTSPPLSPPSSTAFSSPPLPPSLDYTAQTSTTPSSNVRPTPRSCENGGAAATRSIRTTLRTTGIRAHVRPSRDPLLTEIMPS
ncbi:hypothetical protein JCM11251_007288 [Rhodosporidiobolus azoricus]